MKTQDIPSPSTNLREYTHPSSEREHLHGKPVQKGCYKVLNYPLDSWLFWYQSDPEGFHQKLVFRQEFYFPFSYIYLRVSLWEKWYNMEQMTWKPWQTPAVLSSYQAGIQALEELWDFACTAGTGSKVPADGNAQKAIWCLWWASWTHNALSALILYSLQHKWNVRLCHK